MASIRKRGDTFTITAYLGYDESGKQRKKTTTYRPPDGVTPGKAEKLARQYAAIWEDEIRGYVSLDENRTVAELAEWYYTTIAPSILKPNVLVNNRADIQNHVLAFIGNEKLKNVTPSMLDSLANTIQANGYRNSTFKLRDTSAFDNVHVYTLARQYEGIDKSAFYRLHKGGTCRRQTAEKLAAAIGKPFSELFEDIGNHAMMGTSVNKVLASLSAIFNAAVKKEIMRRNPCEHMTKRKNDAKQAAYLNEEQSKLLLLTIHEKADLQFETLINLLLGSGLRAGEALALHWEDIDFRAGTVSVQHTLIRYKGEWVRQSPKTEKSARRVALPPAVLALLKRHRVKQTEQRFAHGGEWKAPDAVFTTASGGYMWTGDLSRRLRHYLEAADLPDIHLHSLRHTHASLLINSNVPVKAISERLGHSKAKTTLEVYSHMFEDADEQAMKAVDMAVFADIAAGQK